MNQLIAFAMMMVAVFVFIALVVLALTGVNLFLIVAQNVLGI